jgi:hypothetical protein
VQGCDCAAEGEVRGRFLVWMEIGEAHLASAEGSLAKARRLSEMGISRDSDYSIKILKYFI